MLSIVSSFQRGAFFFKFIYFFCKIEKNKNKKNETFVKSSFYINNMKERSKVKKSLGFLSPPPTLQTSKRKRKVENQCSSYSILFYSILFYYIYFFRKE